MTQQENPALKYLQNKSKNLSFFQKHYPGVYEFFVNYDLKHCQLDILTDTDEVDLIIAGKHLYGGGAYGYCKQEAEQFLTVFDYGKKIKTFSPLFKGDYRNPRYFAQSLDRLYHKSPVEKENFDGYKIPPFFPMIVFMGCGVGAHIQALCEMRDLQNVLIVENDMDRFAASLYAIDWEYLITPYLRNNEQSFNFVLVPGVTDEEQIRGVVWNHLINYCPIFPVMTLFYNHLASPIFDRVVDKLNSDLYVHLFSFGNYDDELNQLNNARHNFNQGVKRLPIRNDDGFDVPVCVIGSGPSLDGRVAILKALKDKIIIVSCGTALGALYSHGLKPDIHVELESDYNTYSTQALMDDKDYMASVSIVGAAQLSPLLFSLFGKKRLFFKADSSVAGIFSGDGEAIANAAPTCTNAALAIVLHYGFKNIFLFGLDFGFPSKDQHHAKGSLYYKEDAPSGLKDSVDYKDGDVFSVEGVGGTTISTTPFLFASKRQVDNIICASNNCAIYNCSDGAVLENTQWLTIHEATSFIQAEAKNSKSTVLNFLLNEKAASFDEKGTYQSLDEMLEWVSSITVRFREILNKDVIDLVRLTRICSQINLILHEEVLNRNIGYYYFIRGSIWHFLLAGLSHSLVLENKDVQETFISNWQLEFDSFLENLPGHFWSVLIQQKRDFDGDPMVHRSITQPESDEPPVPCFGFMEWIDTGLIVDEFDRYSSS